MLICSVCAAEKNVRNPIRQQLAAMLRGDVPGSNVTIPHMFPKFIRVTNQASTGPTAPIALAVAGGGHGGHGPLWLRKMGPYYLPPPFGPDS